MNVSYRKGALEVTKGHLHHNHILRPERAAMYASNRRLGENEREALKQILPLNPAVAKLKEYCSATFNKPVTLKDVHNLKSQLKASSVSTDALCELVEDISKEGKVSVFLAEENTLEMFAFASKEMLSLYKQYPEVLFIDGTYKVINLEVYIVRVVTSSLFSDQQARLSTLSQHGGRHHRSWPHGFLCLRPD